MLIRALQLLTLAALVNIVYQYWPRGEAEVLVPVIGKNGKYGYVDEHGRVRIALEWDKAFDFDLSGLAKVERDGEFGLVNLAGDVILEPEWEGFGKVNDHGLILIRGPHGLGLVSVAGDVVLTPECRDIGDFDKYGMASVRTSLGSSGIVDVKGNLVVSPEWKFVGVHGPKDLVPVYKNGKWGLVNKKGETVLEPQWDFDYLSGFGENGLSLAYTEVDEEEEGFESITRVGWIDVSGEWVIPPQWEDGRDFDEHGMALVSKGGKFGWINDSGEVLIPLRWDEVNRFECGKYMSDSGFAFVREGAKWGMINRKGRVVHPLAWEGVWWADKSGYAAVMVDNVNFGLVNSSAEMVLEPEWRYLGEFNDFGYAAGHQDKKNGKFLDIPFRGWIDRNGNKVVHPADGDGGIIGRFNGVMYSRWSPMKFEGIEEKYQSLKHWIAGEQFDQSWKHCVVYDKDGNTIWDNNRWTATTKAWTYVAAALLPLLALQWLARRQRKRASQRT